MAIWDIANSVLTNKGLEVLSKVQAGIGSITVESVVSGSGKVIPNSNLPLQTEVLEPKQTLTITNKTATTEGSIIEVQLSNEGVEESYELNQIGIYITHPDYEGRILYMLTQATEADTVPKYSETPAVFNYDLYIYHASTDRITINVSPAGMVKKEDFIKHTQDNYIHFHLTNGIVTENVLNITDDSIPELKDGTFIYVKLDKNLEANSTITFNKISGIPLKMPNDSNVIANSLKSGDILILFYSLSGNYFKIISCTDFYLPKEILGQPNGVAPLNKDKVLEIEYGGTGANNVQEAIYNLGCMPRENLLDNAYFIGGGDFGKFPINQMKLTNYTNMFNNKYGIDRWFGATAWGMAEASQTLEPDGLVVASIPLQSYPDAWGGMWQKIDDLEDYIGQTVTLSIYATDVQTADGTTTLYPKLTVYNENSGVLNHKPILNNGVTYITFEITAPDLMFGIQVNTGATQSNSLKIKAIKLEVGENQTLARQLEDGSWELLEKPDYATELAKCLRYYGEFRKIEGPINECKNNNLWSGHCQAISTDELLVNYQFPVPMRTIPAISVYAKGDGEEMVTINKVRDSSTGASVDISGFTCSYVTNFGFAIIRKQGAFVQSRFYDFIIVANAEL